MLPVFATNQFDLYLFEASSAIWLLAELISALTHQKAQNAQTDDRASSFIIFFCIYVAIALGLNITFSQTQYAIPLFRPFLFGAGILLILVGMAFRLYAIRILGKYFTGVVSIQTGQTVVENGPYHFIRHPSYTGALISFLGFGLALTNWLSLGLVMLVTLFGYSYRVHVEEQALVKGLGQPYREYMQHTKRFIPFIY